MLMIEFIATTIINVYDRRHEWNYDVFVPFESLYNIHYIAYKLTEMYEVNELEATLNTHPELFITNKLWIIIAVSVLFGGQKQIGFIMEWHHL